MPIRLEEDKRTLDSAEALLAGLAKAGVTFEQVSEVKVPSEVKVMGSFDDIGEALRSF